MQAHQLKVFNEVQSKQVRERLEGNKQSEAAAGEGADQGSNAIDVEQQPKHEASHAGGCPAHICISQLVLTNC